MSPFLFSKNKNEKSQGKQNQADTSSQAVSNDYQERKKVFTWLVIFGVLILGFSVWQTSRVLRGPFEKKSANSSAGNTVAVTNQITAKTLDSLKTKDTDLDGVSDYNELYIYQTSPYLSDSDGDDIDDKTEIASSTDPNCPKDQTCSRQTAAGNTNSLTNAATDLTNGLLTDGTDLTAEQLRSVLRDSGVSESELSQVDDATLMQWYQQTLAEQEGTATSTNATTINSDSANANSTNTNQTVTYDDLKGLSITDIRYLLTQSGVPEDTLNQVDDTTLKQIYLDSLAQNAQQTATNTNTNS
ncbi:MAG: hypothetical protein WCT27_02600 [Patescibacteria group bacterium]